MTEVSAPAAVPPTRRGRRGPLSRFFRWLLAIWVLLALLVLGALLALQIAGWKLHVIESASMEPTVQRDSLVAVAPVPAGELRVGDIVIFRDPLDRDRFVMDRIVAIMRQPGITALQTKGDANPEPDPELVSAAAVEGRMRVRVPYAGMLARNLSTPVGASAVVAIPVLLVLLSEVAARRYRRRHAKLSEPAAPADVEVPSDAAAVASPVSPVAPVAVEEHPAGEPAGEPEPPYESSVPIADDDTADEESAATRSELARAMARADSSRAHDLLAQWREETERRIREAQEHAHELLGAPPAPAPTPADAPGDSPAPADADAVPRKPPARKR